MHSPEEIEQRFNYIIQEIENGRALRKICKDEKALNKNLFYQLINKDEVKREQYARATEIRADAIFDEIIEIADDDKHDTIIDEKGRAIENKEWVNRSRLKVDARKWIASKLNPKKYGDKIDVTSDNEKINTTPIFPQNPLDSKLDE